MSSHCLKCKKKTETQKPRVEEIKTEEWCFHEAVLFVVIKNLDLLKIKKLVDY